VSEIRSTTGNLLNVLTGELLVRAANVAVAVWIGRVFGAATLGTYVATLAVATIAERIADNGLELTAISEVSRRPDALSTIATISYVDKTILSIASIGTLLAIGWIVGLSSSHWLIAAALTVRAFLYSYCRLNAGLLKALNKTKYLVRIQGLHFALIIAALVVAYLTRQSIVTLLLCLVTAQSAEFLVAMIVLCKFGLRASAISAALCWQFLRSSTPIGVTYMLSTLMLRGDVVVLSLIASPLVVGTFAAANTGLVVIYVIAWLFSGVLLSDLGALSRDQDELEAYFRKCLRSIVLLSAPASILSLLLAPIAIRLTFGRSFEAAGFLAALMMAALPFIFANSAFLSRAVARNASRTALAIYAFTAVVSLLLNYILGRWHQASGVACSIVTREAVMTLAFLRFWNLPREPVQSPACSQFNSELAESVKT
jgi:O-antigen/teichoic acid export membrane protein